MTTADLHLELYPKQIELYRLIEKSKSSWIGYGGSRGGGKSGALRRIMLARRFSHPGTWGIIVRRVFDELKRNHIDELFREYPNLKQYYKVGDKELTLPDTNGSKIFFGYAETLDEVKRKFMGGQYMDVFVDQAEQFTEQEHREIKQAARWPGSAVGACKYTMFFNMGGAGIQYLKRIFHTKEYQGKERAEDYAFVHAHAWDNASWVEAALREDGLTLHDYYSWPDDKRKEYCANRSDYGINLTSQDQILVARDWEGSWEVLEGAYFGAVWDRNKAVVSTDQIKALAKSWWPRWISGDWGRDHHATTYWHTRGVISAQEAVDILGWPVDLPINLTITYRELVKREMSELDYARMIIDMTPEAERPQIKSNFWGHDIFGERSSQNTIAQQMDGIFKSEGFPQCEHADIDRVGAASLAYNLFLETKRMAATNEECVLLGPDCPELINSIPALMRDPKKLEDIQKTNSNTNPMDDCWDGWRHGIKSMLNARLIAPRDVRYAQEVESISDYTARHLAAMRFNANETKRQRRGWR